MEQVKTRYSETEFLEFDELIVGKLNEAKKQLKICSSQLIESSQSPDSKIKGLDDGVGTRDNERLMTMVGRIKKHIQHLENARIRIKNKVYGVCRKTGKLISKERLKAVPHATLSIEAKQSKFRS